MKFIATPMQRLGKTLQTPEESPQALGKALQTAGKGPANTGERACKQQKKALQTLRQALQNAGKSPANSRRKSKVALRIATIRRQAAT